MHCSTLIPALVGSLGGTDKLIDQTSEPRGRLEAREWGIRCSDASECAIGGKKLQDLRLRIRIA